jgi:hypothetical protein
MSTRQQTEDVQNVTSCEKSDCCSTSDDGSPMCEIPVKTASVDTSCGCASTAATSSSCDCNSAATSVIEVRQISGEPVKKKGWIDIDGCKQTWQKIRGGVMFVVACITSPCCTPLLVPLVLSLIAGTPLAAWLGQNVGWVYGGLTLVSAVSLVVGLRWLNKPGKSKSIILRSDIPVMSTFAGDKARVD